MMLKTTVTCLGMRIYDWFDAVEGKDSDGPQIVAIIRTENTKGLPKRVAGVVVPLEFYVDFLEQLNDVTGLKEIKEILEEIKGADKVRK